MAAANRTYDVPPHPITGLGRQELLAVIAAFAIFALGFSVVIVAMHMAQGLSGKEVVWSRRIATPPAPPPQPRPMDFELSGVRFGISTATLARQHPGTRFNTGRSGKTVGAFERDGGIYTVGFLPAQLGGSAYEVRYRQTFVRHDENSVLAELGRRFGTPATSSCDRRDVAASAPCRFYWYPEDAVSVEALTRRVAGLDGPGRGTEVTLIARDTFAVGRFRRAAEKHDKPLSPLGRLIEKLPF